MTRRVPDGNHLLEVEALARVEGEGGMRVVVVDGRVTLVELRIFEPPRFFEGLLRGRAAPEVPDITSRICGICPVAYQVTAAQAIEQAYGMRLPQELRQLRRLLYCGEIIESHALHVFLLHTPDFLGYPSVIEMAREHRETVELGLRLKKCGNQLLTVIGGRSVHPVNVRIGGFHRLPGRSELAQLRPVLQQGREDALRTVNLVASFEFPDYEAQYEYLALDSEIGYPIDAGETITTTGGDRFPVSEFTARTTERQVLHSTALHSRLADGRSYVVGPLARYALASGRLSSVARQAATAAGLGEICRNPFRSIVIRAVEMVYACDEALRIIDSWTGAAFPAVAFTQPAESSIGHAATEAPRGLLYHSYQVDPAGNIERANLVPPTAQNLASIEADLRDFVQTRLDLPKEELTRQCEQAIRNYDPCISCATHFLNLRIEHR
jgi:sulfhydrogenase subunit alpha